METIALHDEDEARLLELFRANNQEDKEWVLKVAERGATRDSRPQTSRIHVISGVSTQKSPT